MSEKNAELLRRAYVRFNEIGRDVPEHVDMAAIVPELWERLAPNVELHERPDVVDRKVYVGPDDCNGFFRKTWELFSEIRYEISEVIDADDVVVLVARVYGVGRGSDIPVEMDESDVWWFRDGQIVQIEGFGTKEEALASIVRSELPGSPGR